jgi:hypothetical protein
MANDPCWTIDSALTHVLTLMDANDKRYEQRFDASQKALELGLVAQKAAVEAALASQSAAVIKAEIAADKRFDSVNEFRNTLADQQRNLIPRSEVEVIERSMTDKIAALQKQVEGLLAERAGIRGGWGYAVGVVGLVLALGSIVAVGVSLAR